MVDDVAQILRDSRAVLDGHFLLNSGRHSARYLEKFQVLQFPEYTGRLCRLIADHFRSAKVDVVAGPTTGGILLAYEVARQLGVRGIFAERDAEGRTFRRGFRIRPGERVLLVDDILTTGSSVPDLIGAVRSGQGNIVGIGVLVDRSGGKVQFGLPFFACHRIDVQTYAPESCPLCEKGIPLQKPGGG